MVHTFVVHKFVYHKKRCIFVAENQFGMEKTFVYGVSVDGDNFTDRETETKRLQLDFENGVNVILISPRRMGKTSLVRRVQETVSSDDVIVVYMDVYDCRSEYDFYNRFATELLKQTASHINNVVENVKDFLSRVSPKISFNPDANNDISISLGITPKEYQPEELLQLPETIAKKKKKHIVVCIDEFQQIGSFSDSVTTQKKMRGVWQHQHNVSYCLFGSKQHLLTQIFQSKNMPFYQFGDIVYLNPIPTEKWITFIQKKFLNKNLSISDVYCEKICSVVNNHSSYVQQLAWNVMLNTEDVVTEESFQNGLSDLLINNSPLFMQQIEGLTTYQMNFLKMLAANVNSDFMSSKILSEYQLGSKSNIPRLKRTLLEKELIEIRLDGVYFSDPVFKMWFKREWCK